MSSFLKQIVKNTNNEYAALLDEGYGEITNWVDTGSLALNALISGSMFKGIPGNKVVALAGEPSVGKTYITVSNVAKFLNDNPTGQVVYFESEFAIAQSMMEARGVDSSRVAVFPVKTVQDFRTQAMQILTQYKELKPKDRPPLYLVLDSLGNLSTDKEMTDMREGSDKRDMTRAQLIKGAFRALTLEMGVLGVPMMITNHIYDVVGSYIPLKKMGGGSGLEYAASQVVFLSKKKHKETTGEEKGETTGVLITAVLKKSRLTREDKKVELLLRFDTGLDRYYGLIELAEKFNIIEKVVAGRSFKYVFPDKTEASEKEISANPEKYWTKDVLEILDKACQEEFLYGNTNFADNDEKEVK